MKFQKPLKYHGQLPESFFFLTKLPQKNKSLKAWQ